jgi:hypothetical protein
MEGSKVWPGYGDLYQPPCHGHEKINAYHVERFENLALVRRTVTIKSESNGVLLHIFVGKGDTSTQWNLGTDNTITSEESRGENVHGTTLSV